MKKTKLISRFLSIILCFTLMLSISSIYAFADEATVMYNYECGDNNHYGHNDNCQSVVYELYTGNEETDTTNGAINLSDSQSIFFNKDTYIDKDLVIGEDTGDEVIINIGLYDCLVTVKHSKTITVKSGTILNLCRLTTAFASYDSLFNCGQLIIEDGAVVNLYSIQISTESFLSSGWVNVYNSSIDNSVTPIQTEGTFNIYNNTEILSPINNSGSLYIEPDDSTNKTFISLDSSLITNEGTISGALNFKNSKKYSKYAIINKNSGKLKNLTVKNCTESDFNNTTGNCILNEGNGTLDNVTITNCKTAVTNTGTLTIKNSTITDNLCGVENFGTTNITGNTNIINNGDNTLADSTEIHKYRNFVVNDGSTLSCTDLFENALIGISCTNTDGSYKESFTLPDVAAYSNNIISDYERYRVTVSNRNLMFTWQHLVKLHFTFSFDGLPDVLSIYCVMDEDITVPYDFKANGYEITEIIDLDYGDIVSKEFPFICTGDAEYQVFAKPLDTQILYGDVDLDGKVTILDATTIQLHLANLLILTDEQMARAVVSGKEKLTIIDATYIQQKLASLIDVFPVES